MLHTSIFLLDNINLIMKGISEEMARRYAKIDSSRCVACGECSYVCPREAIIIQNGCYAEVDNNLCIGCGLCAKSCPAVCITILQKETVVQ